MNQWKKNKFYPKISIEKSVRLTQDAFLLIKNRNSFHFNCSIHSFFGVVSH